MMTGTSRILWSYVRPNLGVLGLALGCMAANALATGFYAYLVGPVVKFLFTGGLNEGDSLTRLLEAAGLTPRLGDGAYLLMLLPVLILGAALIKGASQYGKFYLMGIFGERSVFRLRADLLAKLHRLPLPRFDAGSSGDFITRLGSDVTLVQEAVTNAVGSLISDSLKVAVLLGVAVALDWKLALITFVVLPFVAIPIVRVGRRLKRTATDCQEVRAKMASQVQEDVSGIRVIKGFGLERTRQGRFEQLNRTYLAASLRSFSIRAFASPLMEIMGALGLAATLWLAGARMAAGVLVPEHFVSFFAAVLMLYEPMKNLGRLNNIIQPGRAGAERALELLKWEEEGDLDRGGRRPKELREAIRFEAVSFSYGDRPALSRVDLEIRAGSTVAIVGESGSGKTTLAHLLTRNYAPTAGRVTFDGVPLDHIPLDHLRRLVAVVEQRPILFDDTILNNVRLGNPDAGRKDVDRAIEKARLAQLVRSLPEGAETMVGEGGVRLSEGEKQRVAIARAFLRGSPVVVFDEVTASLDAANEAAIRDAIRDLAASRTVLIIAHRLSTIRDAGRIVVMDGGEVVEAGTHEQLVVSGGIYSRFAALQAGSG